MTSLENAAEPEAWFKLERDGKKLAVGGAWTIAESARLDRELTALKLPERGPLTIDASKISRLDSAGAWLLIRTRRALKRQEERIADLHLPELYRPLLETLDQPRKSEPHKSRIPPGFRGRLYKIGARPRIILPNPYRCWAIWAG